MFACLAGQAGLPLHFYQTFGFRVPKGLDFQQLHPIPTSVELAEACRQAVVRIRHVFPVICVLLYK